jgi:hypothetical protein
LNKVKNSKKTDSATRKNEGMFYLVCAPETDLRAIPVCDGFAGVFLS